MAIASHLESFTVRGYEAGVDNRLTVQSLCNYTQEAAGIHAARLGISLERLQSEGISWVLSRMQIALHSMPLAGETISVETWPVSVEGLQFRRDFIVRHADGSLVATAISHWVVVTLATRRVGRIPAFISSVALDNAATAMQDSGVRLPAVGQEHEAVHIRAQFADMDRNWHVNSVRYVDWVLEAVPGDTRRECALRSLELVFRAESFQGDEVSARTRKEEAPEGGVTVFSHGLVRAGDDKELVRARSVWQSIH